MPILTQLRSLGYIIAAFAVAGLVLAWQIEKRGHRKARDRIVELTQLRISDRQSYEAAQREAAAKNQAEVAQIERQQEIVTNEIASDYRRQLADLRLRAQARANQGAAGKPGVSKDGKAPGGTDADGLLLPDERLQAEEIELRLMHLQNWVERQADTGRQASPN